MSDGHQSQNQERERERRDKKGAKWRMRPPVLVLLQFETGTIVVTLDCSIRLTVTVSWEAIAVTRSHSFAPKLLNCRVTQVDFLLAQLSLSLSWPDDSVLCVWERRGREGKGEGEGKLSLNWRWVESFTHVKYVGTYSKVGEIEKETSWNLSWERPSHTL